MIRSKQLAVVLLAASIPAVALLGTVTGCRTTVIQPVEVQHHSPADDHHDDHPNDDHGGPDRH